MTKPSDLDWAEVDRETNAAEASARTASRLKSYDYLLSKEITTEQAVRRLRFLRAGRAALEARDAG